VTATTNVLSLSLISHTNAGKTTLARTLLRRDVGDVLDQAHVTDAAERFVMLELEPEPAGAGREAAEPAGRIVLWDTPGFGDSARLLRRLEGHEDPLGWMRQQRWDRVADRPLYSSQHAVANVMDHADVILYLVNASEDPGEAGYIEPEMRILGWIDRPVIVVLNQTGGPGDAETRRAAEERWRWHLASHAAVRDVISLDAFTRCWIQEGLLLLRLQALVPEAHRGLMTRLLERWRADNLRILDRAMDSLAELLWDAAADREPVGDGTLARIARRRAVGLLTRRLAEATRGSLETLIGLYGLDGESAAWASGALEDVSVPGDRPDPLRASVLGGVVGGALGGLAADVASFGLSLGGGAIAGALLGGLGLGGLAWAFEQLGGPHEPQVVWSHPFLRRLTGDAVVRYLAVAHYGRGSGRYCERMEPALWRPLVDRVVDSQTRKLSRQLERARSDAEAGPVGAGGRAAGIEELSSLLGALVRTCLIELYPGAERYLGAG
jgi:hypothetical protein